MHDHVEQQNPLVTASDELQHTDKHQENEHEKDEIIQTNEEHRDTNENCCVTKTLRMRNSEDGLSNSDKSRDNISLDTKLGKGRSSQDFSNTDLSSLLKKPCRPTTRGSRSWPFASFRNNSSYISLKTHLKDKPKTEPPRDYLNAFHERQRSESEPLIKNEIKRNTPKTAESALSSASSPDHIESPDCSGISTMFVPSKVGEWMVVDLDYQSYEIAEAERVAIARSNYRKKKLKWRCSII